MKAGLYIIVQLFVTLSALQEEPRHQFKKLSFQTYEMSKINCTLHEARMKQKQLTAWVTEIECGFICGHFYPCVYFVVGETDLNCLVCTYDPLHKLLTGDAFKIWPEQIDSLTYFWMKMYMYIGNEVTGGTVMDTPVAFTMVDTSPIPERLKIYSFLYNAGAVDRPIYFGIYRRYDENACNFELIHLWTTVSHQFGLNEYIVSDYVAAKGDYIGFSWTQGSVILFNYGTSPRYCSLYSATEVGEKYSFSTTYEARIYDLLVKFNLIV